MALWLKYLIEIIFSIGLFANAFLFLPQAIKIFKTKNISDLSLITFLGFNIIQMFGILHGYLHNDYILVFGFGLSFIFCGLVTTLILIYRK
jgi:MtN3 and saliva related transmembrane protein